MRIRGLAVIIPHKYGLSPSLVGSLCTSSCFPLSLRVEKFSFILHSYRSSPLTLLLSKWLTINLLYTYHYTIAGFEKILGPASQAIYVGLD
jgi:hypothetical protein